MRQQGGGGKGRGGGQEKAAGGRRCAAVIMETRRSGRCSRTTEYGEKFMTQAAAGTEDISIMV